jgi:hypothetical protein
MIVLKGIREDRVGEVKERKITAEWEGDRFGHLKGIRGAAPRGRQEGSAGGKARRREVGT